jgi:hypothetical protein
MLRSGFAPVTVVLALVTVPLPSQIPVAGTVAIRRAGPVSLPAVPLALVSTLSCVELAAPSVFATDVDRVEVIAGVERCSVVSVTTIAEGRFIVFDRIGPGAVAGQDVYWSPVWSVL